MVALIDVGCNQSSGLGVGSSNDEVLDTHNVELKTDGDKTVDVLLDWNENLSGHMSALLGPWSLVLDVDPSGTFLDKELGKFHGGGEATMTSVGVGDDWSHIIDGGS